MQGKKWSEYDKDWFEKYSLAKKYYEENGNLKIPVTYSCEKHGTKINLGTWIRWQRENNGLGKLPKYRKELLNEIGMIWKIRNDSWEYMYKEATNYYKEKGNLKVPTVYSYIKDGEKIKLGSWIATQRVIYKNGKLSAKRKELLNEIGMIWKINNAYSWEYMYEEAVNYYKKKGNLRVPMVYSYIKDDEVINLGNWIVSQRIIYNNGKLSAKRKELLDKIGMVWKAKFSWEYMFNLAKDYYLKNNKLFTTNYKVNIDGNNILLGVWLNKQKNFYNKGKLTEEKIKLLETIGLKWTREERKQIRENEKNKKWLLLYKAVINYYKEHGNLVIPNNYLVTVDHEEILLKSWYKKQKSMLKQKELSPEKEKLINGLFSLDEDNKIKTENDKKWMFFYNLAKEYYNHSGNIKIPSEYEVIVNGKVKKLGKWIDRQRTIYKKGKLNEEMIKLLNELGMIWEFGSIRYSEWLDNYELVKKYYEEYGNLDIPSSYVVNDKLFSLRDWLRRQRMLYELGKLNEEKINLLNEIGMVWNSKTLKK